MDGESRRERRVSGRWKAPWYINYLQQKHNAQYTMLSGVIGRIGIPLTRLLIVPYEVKRRPIIISVLLAFTLLRKHRDLPCTILRNPNRVKWEKVASEAS